MARKVWEIDCRLQIADCRLPFGICNLQSAICNPIMRESWNMPALGRQHRLLLPGNWLDALRRDGYYACNLGPLSEVDLQRVARKLNGLGEDLVPGPIIELNCAPGSPYLTLSRSAVPFHNDGAFRSMPPRYLILYCEEPGS